MTLTELRDVVFERIGVHDGAEILSDRDLVRNWIQATKYWARYMDSTSSGGSGPGPRNMVITVDESLMYTFTDTIPARITALFSLPNGKEVPCWTFFYSKPVLTLYADRGGVAGEYAVFFNGSLSYEQMSPDDIPFHLLDLYAAYIKRATGSFLKFSGYQDKPFDVDGEQWYREGAEWAKELENFIMVNRDERMSNISDLTLRNRRTFW